MNLLEALQAQPFLWIGTATILGLLVGSFLNVLILRLPVMLERQWRAQCAELMGEDAPAGEREERFDLLHPPSRCPRCGHRIRPWENVPVL
ncbi:MAG TPA: prepilin peptidase, partial [Thiotrichales bacterium]|nr:prepilin peptidase [Thiotrichales bacterium]